MGATAPNSQGSGPTPLPLAALPSPERLPVSVQVPETRA